MSAPDEPSPLPARRAPAPVVLPDLDGDEIDLRTDTRIGPGDDDPVLAGGIRAGGVQVVSVAATDAAVGRAELYDDEQLDLLDELDDDWVVDEPAPVDGTAPTNGTGPSKGTAATNGHPAAAPPDGDGR